MTFTAEDSADTSHIIDLRPGVARTDAQCNTVTECPRTPADAEVTPLFLIGVLVPCVLVCLLAWAVNRR